MTDKKHRELSTEQYNEISLELTQGSDFACALLGASVLDISLREVLLRHFTRKTNGLVEALFDRPGASLSSLSHKISLSEALGLITADQAATMHKVRQVRNEFAHRAERLTFDKPVIEKLTSQLEPKSAFSSRQKYMRATLISLRALGLLGMRQIAREISKVEAAHKRNLKSLDRKHARYVADIKRAYAFRTRQKAGPPLTKNERAQARRLERKLSALFPEAHTDGV